MSGFACFSLFHQRHSSINEHRNRSYSIGFCEHVLSKLSMHVLVWLIEVRERSSKTGYE